MSTFRKSIQKLQVLLNSDRNNGYYTLRSDAIMTTLAQKEKCFTQNCTENQTNILCSIFFFLENRAFCEIMWVNVIQSNRPQMTAWYKRIACWILKATNTHFSTAAIVACEILNVTLYVYCLSFICVSVNRDAVINENVRICCERRERSSIYDGKKFSEMLT